MEAAAVYHTTRVGTGRGVIWNVEKQTDPWPTVKMEIHPFHQGSTNYTLISSLCTFICLCRSAYFPTQNPLRSTSLPVFASLVSLFALPSWKEPHQRSLASETEANILVEQSLQEPSHLPKRKRPHPTGIGVTLESSPNALDLVRLKYLNVSPERRCDTAATAHRAVDDTVQYRKIELHCPFLH